MSTTETGSEAEKKAGFSPRRLLPLLLIGLVTAAVFVFGLDDYVSFQALRENKHELIAWVDRWGVLSALAFGLIYAAMVTFIPPTGALLTLVGGFLFGWLWGGTIVIFGATLGAIALYLATRTAFADVLKDRAGGAVEKMREGFRKDAVSYMLFLRLVPVFPFFVVNIVPGLLGVPLRTFAWTTFVGIIPGTFVYASIGAGLGAIIDERDPDLGVIFEPQYLLPILGLAALSLIPVILRRFRKRVA